MAVENFTIKYIQEGFEAIERNLDKLTEEERAQIALLKKVNQEYVSTAKSAKKLNDSADGLKQINNGLKSIKQTIVGVFAVQQIAAFAKEVVNTAGQFQKFEAVLTNTLGSRSKARKAMDDIVKFAAETPFAVDELTDSFVKLANRGFVPTTDELRKLGDLASSTGKDFDQLVEALLDAQTLEFERLKEFGIRASKEGDRVKFTFKGVTTEVKGTEAEIRKYILSLGDLQGVSGSMAAISKTLAGQISNLGDSVTQLVVAIGERFSGAISKALGFFSSFVNAAKEFIKIPTSEKLRAEAVELNALVKELQLTNKNSLERKILIEQINALNPELLKGIDAQTASNSELEKQLKKVNAQYVEQILLATQQEKLQEFAQRQLQIAQQQVEVNRARARQGVRSEADDFSGVGTTSDFAAQDADLARRRKKLIADQKNFSSEIADIRKELMRELGVTNQDSLEVMRGYQDEYEKSQRKTVETTKLTEKEIADIRKKAIDEQINLLTATSNLRQQQLKDQSLSSEEQRNIINDIFVIETKIANLKASQIGTQSAFVQLQADQLKLEEDRLARIDEFLSVERIKRKDLNIKINDDAAQLFKSRIDKELNQRADAARREVEIEREKQAQIKAIANEATNQIISLYGSLLDSRTQNIGIELQNLNVQKEEELRLAGENAEKRKAIEANFVEQERRLKNQQARAQKNKEIFDATIAGVRASVQALPNIPLATFIGLFAAAQVGLIASRPIPKFAKGTDFVKLGNNRPGIDTVPAMLTAGEGVSPVHINSQLNRIGVPVNDPRLPEFVAKGLAYESNKSVDIERAIAEGIARGLAKAEQKHITLDKNGFEVYAYTQYQKNKRLNADYSL